MNNRESGSTPTDVLLKEAGINNAQFQENWQNLLSYLPVVLREHAQRGFSGQEQMLATVLFRLLNIQELAQLAAQVGYDYNQRPTAAKPELIVRLVAYAKNSGNIDSLATLIISRRFPAGLSQLPNAEVFDNRTQVEREVTELLNSSFNENELRSLCFRMGTDYDNISDPAGKIIALVNHCKRQGTLPQLKAMIFALRPHLNPNSQVSRPTSNSDYTTTAQPNYSYHDQGRPASYYNTPPQAPTRPAPPYQQPSTPPTGEGYVLRRGEIAQKLKTLYTSKLDLKRLASYFDADYDDVKNMSELAPHAERNPQRLQQVFQLLDRGEKVFTTLTYTGGVVDSVNKPSSILEIAMDLSRKFDQKDQLVAICKQFGVDHEDLAGETVEENLFELVHHLERRGKLAGMIQLVNTIK